MSRTFTVNLCAALLLTAAASPTSAAGLGEGTSAGRPTAICERAHEPLQSRRECISPWCLHRDLDDRTVGPTFPTRCGQRAALPAFGLSG